MSTAIVRRGLDLFKEDIIEEVQAKKKKKKNLASQKRKDLLPLISSNKTGVKKQLKRLKGEKQRNKETVKDRKMKSAFERIPTAEAEDYTDRNVSHLLRLDGSRSRISSQTDKIIEHSRGRLAKDNLIPLSGEQAETSIFSEEDFTEFAKSYVARRKVHNFLLDAQKSGAR